ncbi:MAG: copper homeostasis protein CutC [Mycoplasmatales bacterium]
MNKLEVIVLDERAAIAAEKAGADRLELVAEIEVGGTSPSLEVVKAVVEAVTIPVNVMVRFKTADFIYDDLEMEKVLEYIRQLKTLKFLAPKKINGIVFGSLTKTKEINLEQLVRVIEASDDLAITFHRAIDEVQNQYEELSKLVKYPQVTNILTSAGLEQPIEKNIEQLNKLVNNSHHITIIMGGGVSYQNFENLLCDVPNADMHIGKLAYNELDFTKGINELMIQKIKEKSY